MSWFLALSVRSKMIWSFGIIIFLNIVISIASTYSYLNTIDKSERTNIIFSLAHTKTINTMNALFALDDHVRELLAKENMNYTKDDINKFNLKLDELAKDLIAKADLIREDSLGHLPPPIEYTNVVLALKKEVRLFIDCVKLKTMPTFLQSNVKGIYTYLNDSQLYYDRSVDYIKRTIKMQGDKAILFAQDGAKYTYLYLIVGINILSTLLCLVIAKILTTYITKQLKKQIEYLSYMESGNFSFKVDNPYNDDFGVAIAALNKTKNSLVFVIANMQTSAKKNEQSLFALRDLMSDVDVNAQNIQGQSLTVATASEEMLSTTTDIARNCELASDESNHSQDITNEGVSKVRHTISSIREQSSETKENAKIIANLAQHSADISSIVSTIEDIAAQTNLLALNAAIEAARAGEAGRGFAVVADEVRALAMRTATSTKEISSKVSNIQEMAQNATNSMNKSADMMNNLSDEASDVENILQDITNAVSDVNMQITQIAAASEEQTAATSEITQNIQGVTNKTEDIALRIKESNDLIQNSITVLNEVKEEIAFFKI